MAIRLFPGEHGEILGRVEVGYGKNGMLQNKSGNTNISETRRRKDIEETVTLLWTAYYKKLTNALSNGTIPDPLRPPLPQNWRLAINPH